MTAPRAAGAPREQSRSGTLQAGQVQAMFDRIASVYDVMNTAMTAGLHHRWRARAAELAGVGTGASVLDVATGTGDLAIALAQRAGHGGEVLACDFSEGMLDRARSKAQRLPDGPARPRFEWADAMSLPYGEGSFDAATVGFGARNFSDLGRGLSEMARVVRPGGRVVVLEITTPTRPPLSSFYGLWFDRLVPALGGLVGSAATAAARLRGRSRSAGIAEAYSYLPSSVKRFPDPAGLAREMHDVGLREIRYVILAGGIVAIHHGTVPPREGHAKDRDAAA